MITSKTPLGSTVEINKHYPGDEWLGKRGILKNIYPNLCEIDFQDGYRTNWLVERKHLDVVPMVYIVQYCLEYRHNADYLHWNGFIPCATFDIAKLVIEKDTAFADKKLAWVKGTPIFIYHKPANVDILPYEVHYHNKESHHLFAMRIVSCEIVNGVT